MRCSGHVVSIHAPSLHGFLLIRTVSLLIIKHPKPELGIDYPREVQYIKTTKAGWYGVSCGLSNALKR